MSAPAADPWDRRRLWIVLVAATGLGIALLITLLSSKGGEDGPATQDFEPVYEDLDERRQAAGVSTMGEPADADAHLHPKLALYANGERIQIPVNIGIDPAKPGNQMASLHTHETDGTIHVEGMSDVTLGQFFEIWGVPFSANELGPYKADGDTVLRMWVDGKPSREFGQLKLADGQETVIAYGTSEQVAQTAP